MHNGFFLEIIAFFETHNLQLFVAQQVYRRNLDFGIGVLVCGKTFVFEILAEGIHVIGTNTEDVQGLYFTQTFGKVAWVVACIECRTAFQGILEAFQTDTTAKELNDFGAFAATDIHQAHG